MDQPDTDAPLGALPREVDPPAHLEERIRGTLQARGLLRRGPSQRWRHAAAIAAAVVLLATGYTIGASRRSMPSPVPGGARYALFLYEDARFDTSRPEAELVREYSAWAASLRKRGQLETAAQLVGQERVLVRTPDTLTLEPRGVRSDAGTLTGLFVIRAHDEAEALAIARTSPHLHYGGTVAIRLIAGEVASTGAATGGRR